VVVGRVSTFADPEVIKMATERFVPVCTDDWYTRRRQDAEGEFFRAVADAGGRKGEGGATRQGIYVFAADGTPLGYKNAGQDAEVMKKVFKDALAKFDKLPADKRKAGAVTVPDHGTKDPKYTRTPADGGLIVRVHTRILDAKDGGYRAGTCGTPGGDQSARDFLWLTKAEVKAVAPAKAEAGHSYPLPAAVAARIARFHLADNTRGEPPFWKSDEVRKNDWTLTVTQATADAVDLRLDGEVVLATKADPTDADRGYTAKARGHLRWVPKTQTFDRFDVAVVGPHWGEGAYTKGARPGKSALGFAFTLADPTKPADTIPPQGIRDERPYWGKE
jgi:hypothetical protein